MRTAIMQPYIFPYWGYFQLMNAVDKFVILDDVNYIKKGWINRNRILVNGEASLFTVPLEKPSQNKLINETTLSQEYQKWKEKFLKSLEYNYQKAPCFTDVFVLVKDILKIECFSLTTLLQNSLVKTASYLGIKTHIIQTSSQYAKNDLKGQRRILDICQQEECTHYLNPFAGLELYDKDEFHGNGMEMSFLKSNLFNYKQNNNKFVPGLSIIDILMFNTKSNVRQNLNNYELV